MYAIHRRKFRAIAKEWNKPKSATSGYNISNFRRWFATRKSILSSLRECWFIEWIRRLFIGKIQSVLNRTNIYCQQNAFHLYSNQLLHWTWKNFENLSIGYEMIAKEKFSLLLFKFFSGGKNRLEVNTHTWTILSSIKYLSVYFWLNSGRCCFYWLCTRHKVFIV